MSSLNLPIETDHLILRPIERSDVEAVGRYHILPSVQRYVERPTRYAEDVAAAVAVMRAQIVLHRPGDTLTLAIVRKGDKVLVGQVSLQWSNASAGQGELRFCIDPAHSGKGYLTEALTALIDLAFDHFRIHRLMARCDGRSHHSIKLMQKLGLRLEAHYREHALFQGEWDEELHFAILDREWRPSTKVVDFRPRSAAPDLPRAAI
ncbi:GNAT family N-acetyltransferase [Devosia sediminis]|uniref:GNAT family N-acetyltransferase n=1 Tax=Devosia sediminis TaxID=2798801 RepID=A0A934IX81_9HYPH|nr:GNAT family protein [Devosia sediminis]MBJ3783957.1 GNAT family N-acetyltransferase [Devosia sediminis]